VSQRLNVEKFGLFHKQPLAELVYK